MIIELKKKIKKHLLLNFLFWPHVTNNNMKLWTSQKKKIIEMLCKLTHMRLILIIFSQSMGVVQLTVEATYVDMW